MTKPPLEPAAATADLVALHVYTWTDRVCGARRSARTCHRSVGWSVDEFCRLRRGTCRRTTRRDPGPRLRRLQGFAAGLGQPGRPASRERPRRDDPLRKGMKQ